MISIALAIYLGAIEIGIQIRKAKDPSYTLFTRDIAGLITVFYILFLIFMFLTSLIKGI